MIVGEVLGYIFIAIVVHTRPSTCKLRILQYCHCIRKQDPKSNPPQNKLILQKGYHR